MSIAPEPGDHCLTPACCGHLGITVSDHCSCHINPPCGACVDAPLICDECGCEPGEGDRTDAQHTPGPWAPLDEGDDMGWAVVCPDDEPGTLYICQEVRQGEDNGEADATLIASAPDMAAQLEAQRLRIEELTDCQRIGNKLIKKKDKQLEAQRVLIGELVGSLKRHNDALEDEWLSMDTVIAKKGEQVCELVDWNAHTTAGELLEENASALLAKAREVTQ